MKNARIEYHDLGPDEHGRRRFTLYWIGFNAYTGKVGPRAQEFNAVPAYYESYIARTRPKGRGVA